MYRIITALALASAATLATAATTTKTATQGLDSSASWWERVTVIVGGDGQPQSCRFESSLRPDSAQNCDVESTAGASAKLSDGGSKAEYTRITFERRFSPAAEPNAEAPAGDKLLGQQVMALAIGAKGAVEDCKIVTASGEMRPDYGCKEASAEKFQASARTGVPAGPAYMTILVYAHTEHVV